MPNRAVLWRAKVASETGQERPVIERVRHGLTVDLGGGQKRLMRSVSLVHTHDGREIDTDWDADSGEWLAKSRQLDFDTRVGANATRRLVPRPDHPDEYLAIGRPQWYTNRWRDVPFSTFERVENRFTLGGSGYSLTVAIKPDGVKAVWTIDTPDLVRQFRWPITFTGLLYHEDTNTVTSTTDGETVLWLGAPMWEDSPHPDNPPRLFGAIPYTWDGTHLTYTPTIPAEAVYPIRLDPDFGTSIANNGDDGWAMPTYSLFNNSGAEVIAGESAGGGYGLWLRFTNITIAKDSDITAAHCDFRGSGTGGGGASLYIYLVDEDDHAAPGDLAAWNTDHGIHTTSYGTWTGPATSAGGSYVSGDFAGAVEEVLARSGWTSGYDIGVHIDHISGSGSSNFASRENTSYTEPEIDITYADSAQTVTLSLLSPVTLYAPTVKPKIVLPLLSPVTLYAPVVKSSVTLPLLSPVTLYAPTVKPSVTLPLLSPITLYAPTVQSSVTLPLLSPVTLYAPDVLTTAATIYTPFLSPVTLYAPTIQAEPLIELPLLEATTLYGPTLGQVIELAFLSPVSLFGPSFTVENIVELPLLSPVTLYQPTISGVDVTLPLLSPVTLYAPTIGLAVTLPLLAATTLYAPVVGRVTYQFIPGTFNTPWWEPGRRLWRFYRGVPTPYVVIITDGVASDSPGQVAPTTDERNAADDGSGDNGKAIFTCGRTYSVTAAEKAILETAGYTVSEV